MTEQIGLLNVDGFYNFFLSFIDMAVSEGFIQEDARHLVISAPTAKELVLKLEVIIYRPNQYCYCYVATVRQCVDMY